MENKTIITNDGRPVFENMQDMTGIRFDPALNQWTVPTDLQERAKQFARDTYGYLWVPANLEWAGQKRLLIACCAWEKHSNGRMYLQISLVPLGAAKAT